MAVYTKVARTESAPGAAPTAAARSPDVLRDIARRLEALEKAVFKAGASGADGASTAAKGAAPPPES